LSLPAPDDCGWTERAQIAENDGIVRLAPDGTTPTFTARLAARLPRDEHACRVGRRWHVGNFANAAAAEWVAG
jgi:hypothetical protein